MRSFVAFLLVCVVAAVSAADFPGSFTGIVGNNSVAFSADTFITPATLEGPVTVSFTTTLTDEVEICFSPLSPVSGSKLKDVCSPAQYGASTNTSKNDDVELKFTRKSFSAFSSAKRLSSRFEKASRAVQADDVTTTVNLVPSTAYYLTISSKSKSFGYVTADYDGDTCPDGNFGPNCVEEPVDVFAASDSLNITIDQGAWIYVKPSVAATWGGVEWIAEQLDDEEKGSLELYAGAGYLPDRNNHVDAYDDDDGNTKSLSLHQPYGPTWYVGLFNSGEKAHNLTLTQNVTECNSPNWDFDCGRTLDNITSVSASYNLTDVFKKDAPSSDDMDYFVIIDTHCCGISENATHIRVSAAPQGNGDGPMLLARQGAPPTKSYYNFNSTGDYVNQLILPIIPKAQNKAEDDYEPTGFNPNAWYIGVQGDEDYVLWAGGNCAGNCSDQEHGTCTCDGVECDSASLFRLPTNQTDSFGRCECTSSSYSNYDCTNSNGSSSSPFKTIYIILIAVGGAIVLAVAIGVPVYCYLQNRKRNNYERV